MDDEPAGLELEAHEENSEQRRRQKACGMTPALRNFLGMKIFPLGDRSVRLERKLPSLPTRRGTSYFVARQGANTAISLIKQNEGVKPRNLRALRRTGGVVVPGVCGVPDGVRTRNPIHTPRQVSFGYHFPSQQASKDNRRVRNRLNVYGVR